MPIRHERLRIINGYGPTESTTFSLTYPVPRDSDVAPSLPIGRPIANARIYLLDGRGQPVPLGAVGEIHIGGAGVARGYLNRPELTAERFIASPFVQGDRLYRTGDLARYLPDGNLVFLGRNDHQVKLRGFRIELGEIEARLAEHPAVRQAVVLAREDQPGDKRLVAYVVFTPDALEEEREPGERAAELRAHVAACLPDYMVPAAYVALDALPLTPNGKLDRNALPAPEDAAYARTAYEPPEGEIEQTLARLWTELLGVEQISRHDNFFELGGHSLLAVQMSNRARQRNLSMTIHELFHAPVLHELASKLAACSPCTVTAISVRSSGVRPPIFFVPTGWGSCHYVFRLAENIEIDCPIYALPWQSPQETQLLTLEAMAGRMATMIQAVQPRGPYRLAGCSSGGVLAYAIAQHLLSVDEKVSFLGLIDVGFPLDPAYTPKTHRQSLIDLVRAHRPQEPEEDDFLTRLDEIPPESLFEIAHRSGAFDGLGEAFKEWVTFDLWRQQHHFDQVITKYHVPSLPVTLHLFVHADPEPPRHATAAWDPARWDGWDRWERWESVLPKSSIHLYPVPGTHSSMVMDPANRATLSARFTEALESTHSGTASAHRAFDPLVPMHVPMDRDSCDTPIFCVPGAGASATAFMDMIDALGDRWPIYGLQPRGIDLAELPHGSVEAAAACNLRAIEHLSNAGLVHLIGHSHGGLVAFEMAMRLCPQGRTVASLTLIDSRIRNDGGAVKDVPNHEIMKGFVRTFEDAFERSLYIDDRTIMRGYFDPFVRELHTALVDANILPPRSAPDVLRGPLATYAAARRTPYTPAGRYNGKVHLVLTRDPSLDPDDDRREREATIAAWGAHVVDLEVRLGPGNHMSVLRSPHVQLVAERWKVACAQPHEIRAAPGCSAKDLAV